MQKYQLQGTIQTYKLPETIQKYQLQGTMQNTSYREQYKIPVTGNDAQYQFNSNIQLTGTIQRNQLQGTI